MFKGSTVIKAGLAVAVLMFGAQASALTLTPTTDPRCERGPAPPPGPGPSEADYVNDCYGTSYANPDDLAYKNDNPDEEGYLSGSYDTEFLNTPSDPADAIITYVGGPALLCDAAAKCILGIKDGNQTPEYYFFDLYDFGWNGTDTIELIGFWPGDGAISHVSLWGGPEDDCCDKDVPEPGSLALLGLGLLGLGLTRRRIAK